jgi:hypothetical protein
MLTMTPDRCRIAVRGSGASSYGVEVEVNDVPAVLVADLKGRAVDAGAGGVDRNVDQAELVERRLKDPSSVVST